MRYNKEDLIEWIIRERQPGGQMFERFTERARKVIVQAQEEARKLNQNYIGTEHLLLGLI
ncbi:ATP-dependent Clp protease ATP-binding subunit ClpC, partial [Candidatus Hakubella thermalkaliphila]